jgi:N12 class adenine-specific DNA methylase
MGNIAGISTRESQRAQRILAKIEFMQETHNGAGVIFTTATPITNTLGNQPTTRPLRNDPWTSQGSMILLWGCRKFL